MNKTELFIQIPNSATQSVRFSDTYLAPSSFGLFLGLEFSYDVSGDLQVGQSINMDKDDKSFNTWIDGPATIIGITNSSIYATPSSLVFTDRPLQLPISFTSGESGTVYLSNSIDNNWQQVDLSDNVAFPITFNIADVREINNRNGAYSKTISIPGTKNNNDVFKYIFDIQGVDNYDTRIKVKCNVVVETIPVLEGYIQLNNIVATDNKYWTYECTIFGENANFSKEIDQNARLEDLDFSDLNHDFTIDTITQSWIEDWNYGYYYPLIDINGGQKPNVKRQFFIENFRGSIYAKQYWDRIFRSYGYTYESEFLNSDAFTNLIIPPTKKFLENDPDWRFNSSFRAGITQSTTYFTDFAYIRAGLGTPAQPSFLPFLFTANPLDLSNLLQLDDTTTPNGDPGNNFIQIPAGEFYYKNVFQNNYDKSQEIVLNLDFQISATFSNGVPLTLGQLEGSRFILYCEVYINNTLYQQPIKVVDYGIVNNNDTISTDQSQSLVYSSIFGYDPEPWSLESFDRQQIQLSKLFGTGVLQPNDEVYFKLKILNYRNIDQDISTSEVDQQARFLNTGFNIEFFATTNGQDGTYFFNNINTQLFDNQPVLASEFIPRDIKQIDFINSIVTMFNLYLYQDNNNPKNIFIEPRDRFYNTTEFLNWSNKLDISKEITQTPIVEKYKRITMKYKEDKDFYNASYKSLTNEIYGQFEYLTGDELSNSEKKVEVIFSPTPLNMWSLNDSIYDNAFIYSRIFDAKQPITSENFLKVESNIRILYRKTLPVTSSQLAIWNGDTQYLFNTYPYAGHLDNPQDPGLDLSFGEPKILFYDNDFGYIDNNLYKEYYEQFFEELYGPESKLITAYVYLNSQDIIDFDYRKLIYIDNISSGSPGYFRVNKIEWDPFNKQSYKVELIKVLNNFKSTYKKITSIGTVTDLPGAGNGLVAGGTNLNIGDNNIIGGLDNFSEGKNNIISGNNNSSSGDNNIINGDKNTIQGKNNSIIGGRLSYISSSDSSIIAGASNSVGGNRNAIISGYDNKITDYSQNSLILSGSSNRIGITGSATQSSPVLNSFILGGCNNNIYSGTTTSNTDNTFLLGGQNNTIAAGVTNSFVIGGENFTATQSNTIYLEGNVLINGNAPATVTPITLNEIAIGTGAGITSLSAFRVTTGRTFIASNNAETDLSSSGSVMIGNASPTIRGSYNSIISSQGATQGGSLNTIIASSGSDIQNNILNEQNAIIAAAGSRILGTLSARSTAVIASDLSIIDSAGSVLRSAIIAGNGLTLTENNTLMTSNLRVDGVIRLANSSGTVAINAGATVTVNTTLVTATSRIFVSPMAFISSADGFYVDNIVAGTSFDITHTQVLGSNTTVAWMIINQ